jgi:hypothetical protein
MSTFCSLGRSLTRVSLLVLLVTLVACAIPTVRRQPTPTLASTPAPTVASTPAPTVTAGPFPSPLTGLLGPTPTHCPAGPPLVTFTIDATFGGGFVGGDVFAGRSPVWTTGLNAGASLQLESFAGTVTPSPYPLTKVMWIVGPNYHQPVMLSGHELSTGAPVWFDLSAVGSGPGNPMTRAVLDPAAPNRGDTGNARGTWNIWGILIYFFSAGCYQIDAAWASGSWQVVFAVGR